MLPESRRKSFEVVYNTLRAIFYVFSPQGKYFLLKQIDECFGKKLDSVVSLEVRPVKFPKLFDLF